MHTALARCSAAIESTAPAIAIRKHPHTQGRMRALRPAAASAEAALGFRRIRGIGCGISVSYRRFGGSISIVERDRADTGFGASASDLHLHATSAAAAAPGQATARASQSELTTGDEAASPPSWSRLLFGRSWGTVASPTPATHLPPDVRSAESSESRVVDTEGDGYEALHRSFERECSQHSDMTHPHNGLSLYAWASLTDEQRTRIMELRARAEYAAFKARFEKLLQDEIDGHPCPDVAAANSAPHHAAAAAARYAVITAGELVGVFKTEKEAFIAGDHACPFAPRLFLVMRVSSTLAKSNRGAS